LPSAAESKHVPTAETTEGAELDLVFAFDCTGSMGSYLSQAQANIKEIAKQIIASEHASVRMALVAYRDNPPQESTFATEVHGFTASHDEMASALMKYTAKGGGDGPECVADALYEVSRLAYRPNSAKVCVFIADAPPHGLGESGDGFPNGSPNGHDPYAISHKLAGLGVTVYCVGCEPVLSSQYRFARTFFESVAEVTGGQYVTLGTSKMLADVIIGGAKEEMALEKLMTAAKRELEEGIRKGEVDSSDDDACRTWLSAQMRSKGHQVSSLRCAGRELAESSPAAKDWARCHTLEAVRAKTSAMEPLPEHGTFRAGCRVPAEGLFGGAMAPSMARVETAEMARGADYSSVMAHVSPAQCDRLFTKMKSRSPA